METKDPILTAIVIGAIVLVGVLAVLVHHAT
jgi:hypothetical protein